MRILKKIQNLSFLLCLCAGVTAGAATEAKAKSTDAKTKTAASKSGKAAAKASTHKKIAASQLRANCYRIDEEGQKAVGVSDDELIQIGSVSKLFTTYWALNELGPYARLHTKFYILSNADGSVDVHIAGARDPYFERKSLQFVVSELNKLGIKKINELSFDKRFKFYEDPYDKKVSELHFTSDEEPKGEKTTSELRNGFRHITSGYAALVAEAATKGLKLNKTISMTVKDIAEVNDIDSGTLRSAKLYTYQSVPVLRLLKEMNRNSNNFAADQFFLGLGGKDEFKTFIEESLQLKSDAVRFYNGSGDCYGDESKCKDVPNPANRTYNSATCLAVLELLHGLRSTLIHKDKAGLKLQDVLAVVGKDEPATVNIYENDITDGSVTAKTGTIDPSVALAGMASTKNGPLLFASLFGPAANVSERSQGHEGIEQDLLQFIKKNGGATSLNYKSVPFFVLDEQSKLQAQSDNDHISIKALP